MTLPPTLLCWWEYTSRQSQVNDAENMKETEISKESKGIINKLDGFMFAIWNDLLND